MLYLVPTVYRFKYYFAWGVAESGLTLSGFNFNGQDDRGVFMWDRYVNARIKHVEGQTSLAKLPEHWNVCTGLFLRQCKVHVNQLDSALVTHDEEHDVLHKLQEYLVYHVAYGML